MSGGHTPGRWVCRPWSDKEAEVVALLKGKKSLICAGVLNDDARLIAAAPDLLAALEDALPLLEKAYEGQWAENNIFPPIRAAISLATGEPK